MRRVALAALVLCLPLVSLLQACEQQDQPTLTWTTPVECGGEQCGDDEICVEPNPYCSFDADDAGELVDPEPRCEPAPDACLDEPSEAQATECLLDEVCAEAVFENNTWADGLVECGPIDPHC